MPEYPIASAIFPRDKWPNRDTLHQEPACNKPNRDFRRAYSWGCQACSTGAESFLAVPKRRESTARWGEIRRSSPSAGPSATLEWPRERVLWKLLTSSLRRCRLCCELFQHRCRRMISIRLFRRQYHQRRRVSLRHARQQRYAQALTKLLCINGVEINSPKRLRFSIRRSAWRKRTRCRYCELNACSFNGSGISAVTSIRSFTMLNVVRPMTKCCPGSNCACETSSPFTNTGLRVSGKRRDFEPHTVPV